MLRWITVARSWHVLIRIGIATPWTEDGFRASVWTLRKQLKAAGRIGDGLTVHGLRHTCGTLMKEPGFDLDTIADMLGQEDAGMAAWYARDAEPSMLFGAPGEGVAGGSQEIGVMVARKRGRTPRASSTPCDGTDDPPAYICARYARSICCHGRARFRLKSASKPVAER